MSDLSISTTVRFLQETPAQLSDLITGLSDREARSKDGEGNFSVVESICHLRDLESEGFAVRISRIINEIEPFLPDFDGARVAAERNYNAENLDQAMKSFITARNENLERLRNLSVEEMARVGLLEGVGEVSLAGLMELMREHDEGHIEELRAIRTHLMRLRDTATIT